MFFNTFKLISVPKCLTLPLNNFNPTANPLFSISFTFGVVGSVISFGAPNFKLIESA